MATTPCIGAVPVISGFLSRPIESSAQSRFVAAASSPSSSKWAPTGLGEDPPQFRIIRHLAEQVGAQLVQAQADLPDLYAGNIELDPRLVLDDDGMPVGLETDSPCLDAGGDLTVTVGQGEGTELVVEDARWFCDGNGLIAGDEVVIGRDQPARVVRVDYDQNMLTLDRPARWQHGEPVNLKHRGPAPEIGPFSIDISTGDEP